MREEKKVIEAIKQDGINTQGDILEKLKRKYPQYTERSDGKKKRSKKRKTTLIISFAALAACAAIIVPCAVLLPDKDENNDIITRYCTQNEYSKEKSEYTMRDHSENTGGNILYFDWYDELEDYTAYRYVDNVDNEILCFGESVFWVNFGDPIIFYVTKSNVYLSMFDNMIANCKNEQIVGDHAVKWVVNENSAQCIFEDNGNRYFITILQSQDENRLFELVGELLGKD